MPAPAVVMNDRIMGMCPIHQIPGPPVGNPIPSPPLPFSAPLTVGLSTKVRIRGRFAAVMGSSGFNTPPHVGLHASDPFLVPLNQKGEVLTGSLKVRFGGQPAATGTSTAKCCATPGQIMPTVLDVLIG